MTENITVDWIQDIYAALQGRPHIVALLCNGQDIEHITEEMNKLQVTVDVKAMGDSYIPLGTMVAILSDRTIMLVEMDLDVIAVPAAKDK